MKRFKHPLLLFTMMLAVLVGCQKEVSFEQPVVNPSAGSLKKDAFGDCSPALVKGTYKTNTALGDTNYVDIEVMVTKAGNYTIFTDTVNNYSFKATGTFTSAGPTTVRLKGSGNPTAVGADDFTVYYDTSICFFTVPVIAGPPPSGNPASFTLAGAPNACGSFTPNGNYVLNTALNSTNTVTVGVNVTAIGTYTITTNTINGFSFSGSGNFTSTGAQTVVLNGAGTPSAAGASNFIVTAGSSTCTFSINVSATPPANAVFTFAGAPGACGSFTPQGTYTAGTPLNATNTVTVGVNVTTIGAYTITTNTVNGITFSKTGTFTVTGPQTVVLNGSGTPTAAGTPNFSVSSGTIPSCSFSVTCTGGTPTNTDYFPLTANSWWSYDEASSPGDSVKYSNVLTGSFGGNTYRGFEITDDGGPLDTSYYRRSGNDYFEWTLVDNYTSVTFDTEQSGAILFLKEGLSNNQTWSSAEFSGVAGGNPTKIRYDFTCTNNNATVTVNGKTFNNVYKIKMEPKFNIMNLGYNATGEVWEFFYAKGIGLIHWNVIIGGTTLFDINIRSWVVQ
jgi:hypothetical protein